MLGAMKYRLSIKDLHTGKAQFFYDIVRTEFCPPANLPEGEYQWYVKAISTSGEVISKGQFVEIVAKDRLRKVLDAIALERSTRKSKHKTFIAFGNELTYESNKELKNEEIRRNELTVRTFPLNMLFNIGHKCNVDCIMCPSGRKVDNRQIPRYFIDDLNDYLPLLDNVLVSGGEPLIYSKYLKEMMNMVEHSHNAKISIHTNGLLIDRHWAKLINAGMFRNISISIDGATAKTYESIRRGAKFKKVLNALELITNQDSDVQVTLTFVVMRRNYREVIDFIELGHRYNVKEIVFQPIRVQLFPELESENLLYDLGACEELLKIFNESDTLCTEYGINLVDKVRPFIFNTYPELIKDSNSLSYLPDYVLNLGIEKDIKERVRSLFLQKKPDISTKRVIPKIDADAFRSSRRPFFCNVPFENLNVDVEDSLICCSSTREFYCIPYGRTWMYLHDIWNSELFQKARKIMLDGEGSSELCHPVCAFYHKGGYQIERDKYLWV